MTLENNSEFANLCVFPPNKPMESIANFSTTPVVYDHLTFLDNNEAGEWILGTSSVTGTFWEGTLMFFKDSEKLQKFQHSAHYIYATTSDGRFINDKTIALAEDTGVLSIFNITEDKLVRDQHYRHSQRISEIAPWKNSNKILTCSGSVLSIWDINTSENNFQYSDYHLAPVNSVDVIQGNENFFASASNDRKAVVWDVRAEQPASVIYSNEFSSLKSIRWNQNDTNYLFVGSQAGDIYIIDQREPKEFVCVHHCFDNNIHKISLSDSNKVAVCGDTNEIIIADLEAASFQNVKSNIEHQGYVRDLKWNKNSLYSCGHDKLVLIHNM